MPNPADLHEASSLRLIALLLATVLGGTATDLSATDRRGECAVAPPDTQIRFRGEITAPGDLSAIARLGDTLIIGSDEGNKVQALKGDNGVYSAVWKPIELPGTGGEVDVEAIAVSGKQVYVAGSHSTTRRPVRGDLTQAQNRKRIRVVDIEPDRAQVVRFTLDPVNGAVTSMERSSLGGWIDEDPILQRFTGIPSKENGVDIEGLAVRGDELFFGFRGPVLRGNLVPILVTGFESSSDAELRFVDLGGLGVRDMTSVGTGFLILAGPVGDAKGPYEFYFWDGKDETPGRDRDPRTVRRACQVPPPLPGGPEGITVIGTEETCHSVVILFDGPADGAPVVVRVCDPGA